MMVQQNQNSKWEKKCKALVSFKETNGHTLVPNRNFQLGNWVSTQRRHYKALKSGKKTPLSQARIQKLEQIGFVWEATKDPRHPSWDDRFKQLTDYKAQHGNCLVPIGYPHNIQLANWVSTQRQEYKLWNAGRHSRLTREKLDKLSSLEFNWDPPRGGFRRKTQKGGGDANNDADANADANTDDTNNYYARIPNSNNASEAAQVLVFLKNSPAKIDDLSKK